MPIPSESAPTATPADRWPTAAREAPTPISPVGRVTVAIAASNARVIAETLVCGEGVVVVAIASAFSDLLTHPEFPCRVLVIDEAPDRQRTAARIALAKVLGCCVVLLPRGSSDLTSSGADAVVRGALDTSMLQMLTRAGADGPPRPDGEGRRTPTERERQALALSQRSLTIPEIAVAMGVTQATASTFLWRARRKLVSNRAAVRAKSSEVERSAETNSSEQLKTDL